MKRNFRRGLAAVCSLAMLASSVAFPVETKVNAAYQLLGETDFDHKILPWMPVESSPARQQFEITGDGELHIRIMSATGADKEKWDLELRHRNLSFRAGHTYELEVKVKAKREGMQLCSQIGNISGSEYYCVLDEDEFHNGPHSGGQWGRAAKLSTEWTNYKGTFTPEKDLDGVQWEFQYARGTQYEGNAVDGDELWFDSISLMDVTEDVLPPDGEPDYGYVNRKNSGLENNYISVNQVGYLCNSRKVAVLGDDRFDMLDGISGGKKITLEEAAEFELVDAVSGKTVFKGKSSDPVKDDDSGDTVCKLDFSEFKTPGKYYLKSGDYISFEFNIGDDIYEEKGHDLLTNAMNFFYQNRSDEDIEAQYITSGNKNQLAHRGLHKVEIGRVQKVWKNSYLSQDEAAATYKSSAISSEGGWYESGSGNAKNVVSGAMAVWTLQNMYERSMAASPDVNMFRDGSGKVVVPETGNDIPDILDEAAYELDWMAKLKVAEDEPTWGEKAAGLYYHKVCDHVPAGVPVDPKIYIYEDDVLPWEPVRIVSPPTFAATLGYAACAAQAARLWAPYDSEKAEKYLASAMDAYEAYLLNYYEADMTAKLHPYYYDYQVPAEELNEESLYAPKWGTDTLNYGDDYVLDDAYLAASEIFISASRMGSDKAEKYLKELESYTDAYKVNTRLKGGDNNFGGGSSIFGKGSFTSFNWGNTAAAGTLSLSLNSDLLSDKNAKKVKDQILAAADEYVETEEKQGYGVPYLVDAVYDDGFGVYSECDPGYEQFSNRCILNNAVIMAYASDLSGEQKYKDGVTSAMDYLLGTNPLSFSYISGYGTYSMDAPYHRYWAESLDHSFPKVPDGVASSGPCGNMDEYMKAMGFVTMKHGNIRQRCYADAMSWSTNSVSLETNASLAWVAAFLQNPMNSISADPTPKVTASPKETASPEPTEKVSPKPTTTPEPTEKTSPKPTASPEPTEKASPLTSPTAVPTEPPAPATDTTSNPGTKETSDKYLDDPYIPGDVDCNGKVDLTDLTTLAISLVDNEPLFNMMEKNADVTGDGKVDLADLATLRQYLSKKITEFPASEKVKE